MAEITLGGETLTLTRPIGRAGRLFAIEVMETLGVVAPVISLIEGGSDLNASDVKVLTSCLKELWKSEEFDYEGDILPGLYMYSNAGLDKEQALKKLDQIADPPLDILWQFATALMYWIALSDDEKEAFEEAQKKLEPAKNKES